MNMCQGCGGVIGRDCFNPQECMSITRQQAGLYEEQSQQAGELQAKVERLEEELEKHRWIPVSERLPEENELVLLWIRNPKSISSGSLDVYRTGFNVGVGNTFYPLKFITHWKPIILPEQALKGGKDGKEDTKS